MSSRAQTSTEERQIIIPSDVALPDDATWINRFHIKSETSNRLYVIAQHREKKYYGCSCPSWRVRRRCKHLSIIGLPNNMQPTALSCTISTTARRPEIVVTGRAISFEGE